MTTPSRPRSSSSQMLSVGLSPRLAQPAAVAAMAGAAQRRKIASRFKPPPLWHQPSSIRMRDLRFEVYFHLPGRSELERVSVHRSQSLMSLQAALQRQFDIPFEQQRLFLDGEQLQGDDELEDYGLQDKSVVVMRVSPHFRRIGDVFSTVRTIRFPSPTARLEEFQVVEVPAGLPPLRIVFQRIVNAITYLTTLDRMQATRTHRRVWRQHVTFWDEPSASCSQPAPSDKKAASLVLQTSSTEHVASILALAKAHGVQVRLQRVSAHRSSLDVRHLKKWLASLKYFADARLPDTTFQELARTSAYMRVSAGEFVFRQGETGDSFYVLITGCVSLAAYGTGFFRTLMPGSCFGEISLIEPLGLRTASACVTFTTTWAELAVVPGDLYRRAIKPYKQVVMRATEKAIVSIPRMHALPSHIITHLAYAASSITAREGWHIICRGEEISVLVLLVQGSVKVSKPATRGKPVIAVIRAPAVLGQEGALARHTTPAPWEIVALETCSLLCLRRDTVASFLSPLQDVVRALMGEHYQRLEDFAHRFNPDGSSRELSLTCTSVDANDTVVAGNFTKHVRNKSIIFPQILVREEAATGVPVTSRLDELARPATSDDCERSSRLNSPRERPTTQPSTRTRSSSSRLESEVSCLRRVLPFTGIAGFQPFKHKRSPQKNTAEILTTAVLLDTLRQLPPEDVRLLSVSPNPSNNPGYQYRFAPLKSP
ncbi:cAMP-dependent protein kinase regulatory subunit [Phytophthora citrophthora]|uniref:cAMP-dependent protein kinase regulatory subunit n=1 Tax=Phytophthora citrophthora TaxID=4793 RepID=A0AAD9GRR0_9STRA|nr:cAMP-dependent protein kinase regulatory subunit [Phytophthora citrophthora]